MAADSSPTRVRLLLVDDEFRILAALRRTLRREGYEIITASSAVEALAILAKTEIAIVLSDHKMPGMSGIELMAAIAERHPATVRLLISGWTEAIAQDRLEALGVRALIPKPWEDSVLKATLRSAAGRPARGSTRGSSRDFALGNSSNIV